jgi:hypothetical protein
MNLWPFASSMDSTLTAGIMKERLNDLRTYLPGKNDIVYDVAAFVATRVKGVEPENFVLMFNFGINDLTKNRDGFTGQPLYDPFDKKGLGRYPAEAFSVVRVLMPNIAAAVGGEEYGNRVRAVSSAPNSATSLLDLL